MSISKARVELDPLRQGLAGLEALVAAGGAHLEGHLDRRPLLQEGGPGLALDGDVGPGHGADGGEHPGQAGDAEQGEGQVVEGDAEEQGHDGPTQDGDPSARDHGDPSRGSASVSR